MPTEDEQQLDTQAIENIIAGVQAAQQAGSAISGGWNNLIKAQDYAYKAVKPYAVSGLSSAAEGIMSQGPLGTLGKAIGFPKLVSGLTNIALSGSKAQSGSANPNSTAGSGNGSFFSPTSADRGYGEYTAPGALTMADFMDQYNNLYSQYGTTTGGPNAAVLRSLNQGIQNKNKQYKQNSASVENMYGQLSQESDSAKESLLGAYEQAVGATGQRASALQGVLSQEGAAQEARRASLAAELGISPESALTQYGSQDRLNEAMGSILGQGQSWQGLLESQKLSARQQADRMRTAIGNTKSATKLSLSEAYQNALNNYQSQIAQEKSKVGTRTLNNPFAKALEARLVEQFNATLPGGAQDKNASADAAKLNLLSELSGKPVSNAYGQEYVNMLALAREAFSVGGEVTPEEFAIVTRFLSAYGLQPSDLPEATTAKVYNR
jgi:hypothetical protein